MAHDADRESDRPDALTHRWRLVTAGSLALGLLLVLSAAAPVLQAMTSARLVASPQTSEFDVPVPATASPCREQAGAAPDAVRWCLPGGISPSSLKSWYSRVLPPGRSAGALLWCMDQVESDGSTRSLWSRGASLVGYQLPPTQLRRPDRPVRTEDGRLVFAVVRLRALCPAVARSRRAQP